MDELWEEFFECFREETRMLFDQVNEYIIVTNIAIRLKCSVMCDTYQYNIIAISQNSKIL